MESSEHNIKQAYSKMAQLCSRSEQCSADIRKKIMAYEIVDEIVDEIISKLIEEKFIDDERYVRAYVNDKFKINKWGKVKMRHYLRAKGLSDSLIQKGLDNIDDEKYRTLLIKTMKEKAKTLKKKSRFEKMGQVIRYAQNRGFEPELIHRYMNEAID
ncbi:regulatory protein RecX [Maribellus sp. YY47]|uniref:regulatory protein RecX n=1 Tax=Maribellus sp. YY47 TaxID=2929486 RepID=UPI0020009561|nr:regulatory protein RecX [Maribellus sp. YY47]MCK3682748.1 RecX family transcriptional regulator [Maribellus sp. YY47]